MNKYKLDAVLEQNFADVMHVVLPPITAESSESLESRSLKKSPRHVKFNETLDIQPADVAERVRGEAADQISRTKAQQEAKLVSLVYREEINRENSEEDPLHPHFPFPKDFKPIDFNHLDPYKLYDAAEYLRQEEQRLAEPFILHAKKMKALSIHAEAALQKEENRLQGLPAQSISKAKRNQAATAGYRVHRAVIKSIRSLDSRRNTLIYSRKHDGSRGKKAMEEIRRKSQMKVARRQITVTDSMTRRNVDVESWLKSNFTVKPVPLILHSPKPPVLSTVFRTAPSAFSSINTPHLLNDPREFHVLNGVVTSPNVFDDTVGNSFAEDYDRRVFNDNAVKNWTSNGYRWVLKMGGFQDHEISFFFKRPFLTVKAETPRTLRRMGQKFEEIVEIPDWLQIENLKMHRLRDGKILIEEELKRFVHSAFTELQYRRSSSFPGLRSKEHLIKYGARQQRVVKYDLIVTLRNSS